MHDPKSIEAFLLEHFPIIKQVVEEDWVERRKSLVEFLTTCATNENFGKWATPYFADMAYWAKTASHDYTNPWDVL